MALIVQKYGGTSVAGPEKIMLVAKRVQVSIEAGYSVVVVVSAMAHTTDELIGLAKCVNPEPNQREMDHLLQTGEIKTASLLAMALEKIGVPAISYGAQKIGLVTTGEHGKAKIREIKERKRIREELKSKVVVIAGFQGLSEESQDITTLGRGGSDTTAVAIAAALNANVCEIYTDVDGVYTVDPRIVTNARRYKTISHEQMITMSAAGAGVLMDRAVRLAKLHNVTLKVMMSPSMGVSIGCTFVTQTSDVKDMEYIDNTAGIAIKKNLGVVIIPKVKNKSGEAAKIYDAIAKLGINVVELIQTEGTKTATINILLEYDDIKTVLNLLKKNYPGIYSKDDCVAVYVIAGAMKEHYGFMAKATKCLGNTKVNINMSGGALSALFVVISEKSLTKAANALAKEFNLLD